MRPQTRADMERLFPELRSHVERAVTMLFEGHPEIEIPPHLVDSLHKRVAGQVGGYVAVRLRDLGMID